MDVAILAGRTFYIKTYGCQMNVYDSQKMALLLSEAGMQEVLEPKDADAIIVNTCNIREKARHKVLTELGFLRPLQEKPRRRVRPVLAIGGCIAQAEGETLAKETAAIMDVIFGTQVYHKLPFLLSQAIARASAEAGACTHSKPPAFVQVDFCAEDKFASLPSSPGCAGSAFLAIQEGCDKFCSYCVVPYTRGVEVSRPVEAVLSEARHLAAGGVCELTLLGQNVNAYQGQTVRGGRMGFAALLEEVAAIPGISRIFYTSSHPVDFEDDLFRVHASYSNIMPFLHLPVQSGSDTILRAMNRRYTASAYKDIIRRMRDAVPHLAVATDLIVGFPGETESDFAATMELVDKVQYAQAFSFIYSRRPGTPASDMPNQIPEDIKAARLQQLQDLLGSQQKAFNEACVSKTLSALFQRPGKRVDQALGKTQYAQSVIVHTQNPDALMQTIRSVHITRATQSCLEGELIP